MFHRASEQLFPLNQSWGFQARSYMKKTAVAKSAGKTDCLPQFYFHISSAHLDGMLFMGRNRSHSLVFIAALRSGSLILPPS